MGASRHVQLTHDLFVETEADGTVIGVDPLKCPEWRQELIETADYFRKYRVCAR